MRVRDTSVEALHTIEDNGLLSVRRLEVYRTVWRHGPMTSAEAFRLINEGRPIRNITQSRARFTELRDLGVFQETGTRICNVTGHRAIEWDVTNKLPSTVKFVKRRHKCRACRGTGYIEDGSQGCFEI